MSLPKFFLTQIQVLKSGGLVEWETQSEWLTREHAESAASHHNEIGDTARVVDDGALTAAKEGGR